jgi:glycerate 2-kinase
VVPDGTDATDLVGDDRVELVRSAHPLPDRRSLHAARRCLALARDAGALGAPLLVLVSGGASSLVCAPAVGVDLRVKRSVVRAMLRSGATVQEINVVRKHLSVIKGGGLARAAAPSPVLSLVASDVIGGAAEDVGSGPSVPDSSTCAEARRALRRFAPRFAELPLARTLSPTSLRARALGVKIVASPEQLAREAGRALAEQGFVVRVLRSSQASVEDLAREYASIAARMGRGSAVVRAAEPSVVVPARAGRGGRSTHLAALVASEGLPRGITFAAIATDGVDGASGTAGAMVDDAFAPSAEDLAAAIAGFDTGPLHLALGTALPERPAGQNLADLHILARR